MKKLVLIMVALALAVASVASAQSVEVGTAFEVGPVPRRDVYGKASFGPWGVEVRQAVRRDDKDNFGAVSLRHGPYGLFVGGGTSEAAILPTKTGGVSYSVSGKVLSGTVTVFGQGFSHGINLAGVNGSADINAKVVVLSLSGTATTDKDTHSYSVSLLRQLKSATVGVYGSFGREVFANPPRDPDALKEFGAVVIAKAAPLISLLGNVGVGKRDVHMYAALRTGVRIGR